MFVYDDTRGIITRQAKIAKTILEYGLYRKYFVYNKIFV